MSWGLLGSGDVFRRVGAALAGATAPGQTGRRMVRTTLAGLVLGLGSVAIGSTLVQATERDGLAGFFEMLFGGGRREAELRPPPRPTRYNTLPPRRLDRPHRVVACSPMPERPERMSGSLGERRQRPRARAETVAAPGRPGAITVCVRRCDGYLFPLGTLRDAADLPLHAGACAAACPNAATEVYTLAAGQMDLEQAVSATGLPYRASAVANVYRQRRVSDCSCQPSGRALHASLEIDPTLHRGDVIATRTSAQVVTRIGGGRVDLRDYRRASIGRASMQAIEARVGTIRRESAARSFRQQIRTAGGDSIVRVAGAGEDFPVPYRQGRTAPRIVSPSPYLR